MLYFIRHGETDFGINKVNQGHSLNPLNANGIKQAKHARDKIATLDIKHVFSSDLPRAVQTAEV